MRLSQRLALATMLVLASVTALADPPHWREQRRDERSNDRRAVRDVVGEVEQNYRGHVVDVQPPGGNEEMYRVRVLQEGGRVKTLRVPANKRGQDRDR